jgi:hypothetical protein
MSPQVNQVKLFSALVITHALLYSSKSFFPFGGAILFVSWSPWLPLAWVTTFFSSTNLIPTPNTFGLAWCLIVWLVLHWFLSGYIVRKVKGSFYVSSTSP